MSLKQRLTDDMKTAMKAGQKEQLAVIRLVLAAIKQREVDERISLDDSQVMTVLEKMLKQRKDSMQQYEAAGREDLAAQERYEMAVIQTYLPEPLSDVELTALVISAIAESGASSARDMGKVVSALKPKVQGRVDMGKLSGLIKERLGG